MDQEHPLTKMEGYGAGPRLCEILETLWFLYQVLQRYNGFHRTTFQPTRGTTQGSLVFLTLFNMLVDNVIRTWMAMTVEDHRVDHDGLLDTVGWCLEFFCSGYIVVGSRYTDWLQLLMNVLVGLFWNYGLAANASKSCQPGLLWSGIS